MMKKSRFGALLLAAAMILQLGLPVFAADTGGLSENQKIQTQEKEVTVTATVPGATASYYITMPSVLSLKDLDATRDYRKEYEIGVHVEHVGDQSLKIASDKVIVYRNTEKTDICLNGYNDFPEQYFTSDGTAKGTLTVYAKDIAKVPQGTYSGNIRFYMTLTESASGGGGGGEPQRPAPSVSQKTVPAHVIMEENGHIKENREPSMCTPFFYKEAELSVREDGMVDVVMYLIDPIPGKNFNSFGTPLQHLFVTGSSADISRDGAETDANASITLKPGNDSFASEVQIDNSSKVDKYFEKDTNGGVFIGSAGTYPSSPVRFSVPLSAVKSSVNGTILLTAYVKPMSVWKQFFLVLDDVEDLGTGGSVGGNIGGNGGNTGGSGSSTGGNDSTGGTDSPGGTGGSGGSGGPGLSDGNNGTYTCTVSMRKSTDINSVSMCNSLFYSKADLKVKGNDTAVTLYVIDPIPNYPDEGTPLRDMIFKANGRDYKASVDSGNQVSRYFQAASGFITDAGNYYASSINVTIPTSAIENSRDGKVLCSAYVNAVMKSTQSFYVVFSDWEKGETESSGEAEKIDETQTPTGLPAAADGNNTGSSVSDKASGSLKDGSYLIPVTALKEKTDESSMMADYMYPKAGLTVNGSTLKLTVYLQHVVAGIDGGGPEWMSYNGTKAASEMNGAEFGGVSYDSFTFTLKDKVPSPMLVSMLVKAMNMEVKARLVFDFDKMTSTDGASLEKALESDAGTAKKASESNAGTAKKASSDVLSEDGKVPAGSLGSGRGGAEGAGPGKRGYLLVTDAVMQGVLLLLLTIAISAAAAVGYWHKKNSI